MSPATFQKTPFPHSGPIQHELSALVESVLSANYMAGSAAGERGAWGQSTNETTLKYLNSQRLTTQEACTHLKGLS